MLHTVLPLPVPASVYGLVLLLAALNFGFVKLDDVKEVGTNFECGISLVNYNDLREGDMIETYQEVEVKAKL